MDRSDMMDGLDFGVETVSDFEALSDSPLRLLALDGGGVRGLSSLMMLEQLMRALNEESPPSPCEVFDLIGGTSTGGLIAIMLGRLEMDVTSCIDAYLRISKDVFQFKKRSRLNMLGKVRDVLQVQGKFDHKKLEEAVQSIVKDAGLDPEAPLRDVSQGEAPCRIFVCATRADFGSHTALLRNYNSPNEEMVCKIWEAARATSAASTFFDPITIGKYGETFVDGGVLVNNPVEVVFNEACKIWPDLSSRLQCIVSLGTGRPAEKDFGANLLDLGRSLITIATETEITHNRFQQFFRHQQISMGMQDAAYLRFNVSSGLEGIGLDEYNQSSKMAAATKAYLRDQHVLDDIGVFVRLIGGNESTGHTPQQLLKPASINDPTRRDFTGSSKASSHSSDSRATRTTSGIQWGDRQWRSREQILTQQCLESFDTLSSMSTEDILSVTKAEFGTLQWLLSHPSICDLLKTPSEGLLQIYGKPGCGKSVAWRFLLDNLSEVHGAAKECSPFLYFACKDTEAERRTATNILASLISQLLGRGPLPKDLVNLYTKRQRRRGTQGNVSENTDTEVAPPWTFNQLLRIFLSLMLRNHSSENLIFILDGLDECERGKERDSLLRSFEQIAKFSKGGKKFILLHRPYHDINFYGVSALKIDLNEETAVDTDLDTYTKEGVDQLILKRPPYLKYRELIYDTLRQRADKMYLLVELLLVMIPDLTNSTPYAVKKALNSLPSSVGEIYEKIWTVRDPWSTLIWSWIIFAFRPLSIEELSTALAVHQLIQSKDQFPPPELSDFVPVDLEGDLQRMFGPLIQISNSNRDVRLIHQTVREHFMEQLGKRHARASHLRLAEVCFRTIDGTTADSLDGDSRSIAASMNSDYTVTGGANLDAMDFAVYAKSYATRHLDEADMIEELSSEESRGMRFRYPKGGWD